MKPIAFKVRGGGNYSGTKGGAVRPNEKGGTGALWYEDKTFTLASTQDQFIATPIDEEHHQRPMTIQQPIPQVPLRFLSVCSGIEAASVAWEPLGWKAVGFSEIEPFPCAVLAHRFPQTPNYGSLTEHASWPIAPGSVDLLVGGTPCQSFSVAGLRKGMADPRGNLALVFLGLADRVKPRWIVWENVPGVLSSNGGRDFGSFLGALEQLGYGWAYRVLDAQHFGVPQRRRRVFVVACLGAGGWESAAKVLFEPESLSGDTAKGRKKGQGVASDAQGGAGSGGCWWDGGQVSQTLDAVLAKGQTMPEKNRFPAVLQPFRKSKRAASTTDDESWVHAFPINTLTMGGRPDAKNDARMTIGVGNNGDPQFTLQANHCHAVATPIAVRRLTPTECMRLQGFPDDWARIPWKGKPADQCPDGPQYKAAGNSMAVPVMRWIGSRIAAVEQLSNQPTK